MTLWLALAAMTALAVALVVVPLLRARAAPADRAAYDREVYRDQLEEIERDRARGLLDPDQAEAARAEVGRRLLALADAAPAAPPARPAAGWAAAAVALLVAAGALAVYAELGAPELALVDPAERAERAAAAAEARQAAALVEQLARRLQDRPDDASGWRLLARSLASMRRYAEALPAFARAVALSPDDGPLRADYGEAITLAGDGTVTPAARQQFEAALARDPRDVRAAFYLGVAEVQAGRRQAGLERWLALEAAAPPDAAWLPDLRGRIAGLASEMALGGDALVALRAAAAAAAPKGPSAADVEAAARLDPAQRTAMIRAMVGQLAARLERNPDDVEGWRRLARSWRVLEEPERARDALAEAARRRPDDAAVLTEYAGALLGATPDGAVPPPAFAATVARLVALAPDAPDTLWLAGLEAQQRGDAAAAARNWRALLPLMEPGTPAHAEVARRLQALGAPP